MKKSLIFIIMLVLLSSCKAANESKKPTRQETSNAQTLIEKTDVRDVKWGMSMSEVESTEVLVSTYSTSDFVYYVTRINNFTVGITYYFNEYDKLYEICYYFKKKKDDNITYMDYIQLILFYSEKYGEPSKNGDFWYDSLYKEDIEYWEYAVTLGHVYFSTIWVTDTTEIELMLTEDNSSCFIGVVYKPIDEILCDFEVDTSGI